ncbi:hypothetical protein TgHK011_003235 [Trichoderma gracile]|nr:hypothetical protein TgHK011_003235 [Trichoderma gracile]
MLSNEPDIRFREYRTVKVLQEGCAPEKLAETTYHAVVVAPNARTHSFEANLVHVLYVSDFNGRAGWLCKSLRTQRPKSSSLFAS